MGKLRISLPLQMTITPEITISKVIGQPINPFIGIAEDFVSFIGRCSDYFTICTRSVTTPAEQYLYGLIQSVRNFISNSPPGRTRNFESDRHRRGFAFGGIRTPV